MRSLSCRTIPILLLLVAGACSRSPTYGRPMPRDTVPATSEPEDPDPEVKDPREPPSTSPS